MKYTLEFNDMNEEKPEHGTECICILRNEVLRATWTGLCWTSKGRPNFLAPDYWAIKPKDI